MLPTFYLRYYVGHKGKFGHEFLEFEVRPNGLLRYANNSNYRNDSLIRKQLTLSPLALQEFMHMIRTSGIITQHQNQHHQPPAQGYQQQAQHDERTLIPKGWPEPDRDGRQELEIVLDGRHVRIITGKLGSIVRVQQSGDPEGLGVFYYLIQDLKTLVLALISMHFKVKPVPFS